MEKSIITFSANEQNLQKTGGIECYASDTVSYVEAQFALGENWNGYDSIRAVWFNDYKTISTVLDPDGICIVPHEVLVNRGKVMVNLVGSVLVSDELSDRLTTFPCEALKVSAKAKISGSETAAVTPSQFEQFVSVVISEVEKVTGMTAQAETLPAGSQATARYENGILYLGIPQGIQGERGDTGADGNGIASVVYNADYSLTLVFDNGERFTTPPIRGERGPAGADGRDGTDGRDGADGVTPNLSVGNVETLEPTQDAYVTRRGTDDNPIFDFGIPKGQNGTVPDLDLILPTDTASGDIASITDGQSVVPVKSLKVTLEPIQSGSGTPSPDNVRPISGRTECVTEVCGVNWFDASATTNLRDFSRSGETFTNTETDTRSSIRLSVLYYSKGAQIGISNETIVTSVGRASRSLNIPSGTDKLRIRDSGSSRDLYFEYPFSGSGSYVLSADFVSVDPTTVGGLVIKNIQLELGTTATAYEPYQGTSYTTDLGRTVYGGTLDVVSGELVVDRVMVDLGSLTYAYQALSGSRHGFSVSISDLRLTTGGSDLLPAISSAYSAKRYNDTWANGNMSYFYPIGRTVIFINNDYTDATEFKTAMNGIQLCYELATPQTYQLDPQQVMLLHGNNNVWSDGSVELTYNADVGLYIDKKLGTSGTRTLSMTRTVDTKSEETKTDDTKSDNIQLAED